MVRSASAGALLLLLFLCACGGGGDDGTMGAQPSNLPANAAAMQTASLKGAKSGIARLTSYEAGMMFALDPGSNLTPGIVVHADNSAGAAPFSVTFAGDLASGFAEPANTHMTGKATFATDPSTSFTSVSGSAAVDITILGVLNVYHADVAFTLGAAERTVSGKGVL